MTNEDLEYIKNTLNFCLDNGNFTQDDLESSYSCICNSINLIEQGLDNNKKLRGRFLTHIEKNWIQNNHSLKNVSCVYVIAGYNFITKDRDIFYIGSTTQLSNRYASHKAPGKVQDLGYMNILYYIEMPFGFYDYEIKMIRKLKPLFNKQHKNVIT